MSPNLKAFLDTIAFSEGTSVAGGHPLTKNDGYDVIVTGVTGPEIFTDYSKHPFAGGRRPKQVSGSLYSTASGRYQHMLRDYAHYVQLLRLPDFGPDSQDRWTIQLIKERRALPLIEAGRVADAIKAVSNLWASFPGAGYGQGEHALDKLVAAYSKFGGNVA